MSRSDATAVSPIPTIGPRQDDAANPFGTADPGHGQSQAPCRDHAGCWPGSRGCHERHVSRGPGVPVPAARGFRWFAAATPAASESRSERRFRRRRSARVRLRNRAVSSIASFSVPCSVPRRCFSPMFLADVPRWCPRGPLYPVEGMARGPRHGRPLAPARKRQLLNSRNGVKSLGGRGNDGVKGACHRGLKKGLSPCVWHPSRLLSVKVRSALPTFVFGGVAGWVRLAFGTGSW